MCVCLCFAYTHHIHIQSFKAWLITLIVLWFPFIRERIKLEHLLLLQFLYIIPSHSRLPAPLREVGPMNLYFTQTFQVTLMAQHWESEAPLPHAEDKIFKASSEWLHGWYSGRLMHWSWIPNCYCLNVCFLPKLICWNPNSEGNGITSWGLCCQLGHEGGALMNGISALIREPREAPHCFHHVRMQWKVTTYGPGKKLPPEPNHTGSWSQISSCQTCEK